MLGRMLHKSRPRSEKCITISCDDVREDQRVLEGTAAPDKATLSPRFTTTTVLEREEIWFYFTVKREWGRLYMPLQLRLSSNVTGQEKRDFIWSIHTQCGNSRRTAEI